MYLYFIWQHFSFLIFIMYLLFYNLLTYNTIFSVTMLLYLSLVIPYSLQSMSCLNQCEIDKHWSYDTFDCYNSGTYLIFFKGHTPSFTDNLLTKNKQTKQYNQLIYTLFVETKPKLAKSEIKLDSAIQ